MKIRNAKYVTGAAHYKHCIVSDLAQIAIVGKSNVGKSSFINYLVGEGKLARISKLPGRTRLINYYIVNDGKDDQFLLTDLPGYGFARVSNDEKVKWANLIDQYLANEQQLKMVLFLVDIRHEPTVDDKIMYNYLFSNHVPFTIIATKADKISKSQVHNHRAKIANILKVGVSNVLPVSSTNKTGKEAVLEILGRVVEYHNEQAQAQLEVDDDIDNVQSAEE